MGGWGSGQGCRKEWVPGGDSWDQCSWQVHGGVGGIHGVIESLWGGIGRIRKVHGGGFVGSRKGGRGQQAKDNPLRVEGREKKSAGLGLV